MAHLTGPVPHAPKRRAHVTAARAGLGCRRDQPARQAATRLHPVPLQGARLCEASESAEAGGLRLANVSAALLAVGPGFFVQQPLAARIALASVQDTSELLRPLLDGGHVTIAGRLAGGMRGIGRAAVADEILTTMEAAGLTVREPQPFEVPQSLLRAGRTESPYVQRLRLMWDEMRQTVIDTFPPPGAVPTDIRATLDLVEERYVTDAYHSLSIEGYQVTAEFIERVRKGQWEPDAQDSEARDAMAAKGYFEAHLKVKDYIAEVLRAQPERWPLYDALTAWYRALFGPSVTAGILRPLDLAGWRNDQVFIRGALHVPLSKEAVRECMPVFFELLAAEPHAAVRAVLGHFFFVYIHPYMDGNGRLARYVFNAMLVTGVMSGRSCPCNSASPTWRRSSKRARTATSGPWRPSSPPWSASRRSNLCPTRDVDPGTQAGSRKRQT